MAEEKPHTHTRLSPETEQELASASLKANCRSRNDGLQKNMDSLRKLVLELAHENAAIEFELGLLQSILGNGCCSAILLRAVIGDLTLFQKPKQLVAFFGMAPSIWQSGKFVSTKTEISKRDSS